MFEFHKDKVWYFNMQFENSRDWIIPFIRPFVDLNENTHVLEVGCAEGGVLKSFLELGCKGVGVELEEQRAEMAKNFLVKDYGERVKIYSQNIYDPSFTDLFAYQFDLIVLKDVIEHIHNQEVIMNHFKKYLKPNGKIFFGFPPWMMPFGGHQQMCKTKFLSYTPWFHLLPMKVYGWILKAFGEDVPSYLEIKETGISTRRFEKIVCEENYKILKKQLFFINPIYKYKFNIDGIVQNKWIAKIPFFNDIVSTCAYYLIESK